MDINLPGMSGIECVRRLARLLPATQIVMLTVFDDTTRFSTRSRPARSGYLLKQTPVTNCSRRSATCRRAVPP